MRKYVIFRTALAAIKRNKKRSFLTMLGIIIGISAVIAIMSLGKGFQREMIESLTEGDNGSVTVNIAFQPNDIVNGIGSQKAFTEEDLRRLERIKGVREAKISKDETTLSYIQLMVRNKEQTEVIEYTQKTDKVIKWGHGFDKKDGQMKKKYAVISSRLARELYRTEKASLKKAVNLNGEYFTIVGIFEDSSIMNAFSTDASIQVPKSTYRYYFPESKPTNMIDLIMEDGAEVTKISQKAIDYLEEEGSMRQAGKYESYDMSSMIDQISQALNSITWFISAIAGISLFIAGIGIMNMMYISVSERNREIGIRRALGATRQAIMLQFLMEGMTITIVGGIIGYLLGMVFAAALSVILPFKASVDLTTVLLALGVSGLIGLVFSVMPASQASKKDLTEVMNS